MQHDTTNKLDKNTLTFLYLGVVCVQSWGLIMLGLSESVVKATAAVKRGGCALRPLSVHWALQPWGSSQWATVCVKVPFFSDNCTLRFHSPYPGFSSSPCLHVHTKDECQMSEWIWAFCVVFLQGIHFILWHNNGHKWFSSLRLYCILKVPYYANHRGPSHTEENPPHPLFLALLPEKFSLESIF